MYTIPLEVEHTGASSQFYDKFDSRYGDRLGFCAGLCLTAFIVATSLTL